jgi:hypothetical protein
VDEARVVADVRVRQEHARRHRGAHRLHLRREVGRRVEEVRVLAVGDAETRDLLRAALAPPRRRARPGVAAHVRHAAVLRDAEDDETPAGVARHGVRLRVGAGCDEQQCGEEEPPNRRY